MNTYNSLVSGVAALTLLAIGLGSCQKQRLGPAITSSNLTKSDITVGLPPVLVAWTGGPAIPYTAYIPSDPPASEMYSVGFSINGKGYVLGGMLTTVSGETEHVPDLWMFDPTAGMWSRQASYPGGGSFVGEQVFVIGNNAFVMIDNTVWQYNQPTNKWTAKSNFPGIARFWGTAIAINGLGYLGLGVNENTFDELKDWWQYDPAADRWTRVADFGGAARFQAAGFASGGKGYVCMGIGTGDYSTVWQYDPPANTWTQKHSLSGLSGGGAVAASGIIGGVNTGLLVWAGELWEYDAASDSWFAETKSINIPGGGQTPAAFVIGNSLYLANIGTKIFHWSR